jgi:hypothetical protein
MKKLIVIALVCLVGCTQNNKKYPIQVVTNDNLSLDYFSVDSVRHDTLWKDGNWFVNKNILNIIYK